MPPSATATEPDSSTPTPGHGPSVGEPPVTVDPRRWGSVIGLVGGMVFISGYSSVLGSLVSTSAWLIGVGLFAAALFAHYIRPVSLGPLERPRPAALAVYAACVVAELALINIGSRALASADLTDLRPALIATVVGLHFIPFAWAFAERMFYWLGGCVAAVGVIGLSLGFMGLTHSPEAMAVTAGLIMQVIIVMYARGRFAPRAPQA